MSNIVQLQQSMIDLQERINREIQFGEDTQRQLLNTIALMEETCGHMRNQVNRWATERSASLNSINGIPKNVVEGEVTPATTTTLTGLQAKLASAQAEQAAE